MSRAPHKRSGCGWASPFFFPLHFRSLAFLCSFLAFTSFLHSLLFLFTSLPTLFLILLLTFDNTPLVTCSTHSTSTCSHTTLHTATNFSPPSSTTPKHLLLQATSDFCPLLSCPLSSLSLSLSLSSFLHTNIHNATTRAAGQDLLQP